MCVVTIETEKLSQRENVTKWVRTNTGVTRHAHEADLRGAWFDLLPRIVMRYVDGDRRSRALLARGHGAGAYESMSRPNSCSMVTDVANIDEAVQADLVEAERLHREIVITRWTVDAGPGASLAAHTG